MMKNITSLLTILALFFWNTSIAQNHYYAPEGKIHLETSTAKILVKFKPGTDFETQKAFLGNFENLKVLERENLLPAPEVTLVNLTNETKEIESLLNEMEVNDLVEYANHFLTSKDGALHGIMDKVIVGLKNESDAATLITLAKGYGAEVETRNEFDELMYHLVVNPESDRNALEVANSLYETGLFAFAEPDFLRIMKRFNTNDTYVDDQWSLDNDGINTSAWNGIAGSDMKVFAAWGTSTGSSSISVAIIDEGVDLVHPDLAGNMLPGFDATGQGSGGAPSGNDAHGTACAGIVAAVGNNSEGIAGVAYGSKIVPVRIAYDDGNGNWITSNTWIANGMNWAYQTGGADILSNSWGGGSSSSAINGAITGAINNGRGGLGAPVLFSAGNGNGAVNYPANNNETIAVIAMSMCDERKSPTSCDGETWWGSDYGTNADVTAPGVKIYATDISGTAGYSSGDYISNFNGTSSACPNAAGVMALILSVNGNLTESAARAALETTCDKAGIYTYNNNVPGQPNGSWTSEMGYGRINADAALNSLAPPSNDDAGISSITAPVGSICATSAIPQVVLQNYGANALTSVDIIYDVDGGTSTTHNWTGNLASGASETVTLSSISFSTGAHTFNAATNNPNGVADTNTNNDDATSNFNSGDQNITLTILTDNYPAETTWDIRDASNNVIASGGPYANSGTTYVHNLCVASACFDFTIYDSYGDGICCAYGNGSYALTEDATGATLASGGVFTFSEATNFCVPTAGPQYTVTTNTNGNGNVTLNPTGGTYNAGTQVTITATADPGWQFDNWSGDLTGSTNPETITVNSNMTITANFSQVPPTQYTLTALVNGNGSVALSPAGGVYNAGTQVTLTATADPGHQFDNWTGDVTGSTNPVTVTVNSNMTTTANFSSTGGGCNYSVIDTEGFESGWGIWNDGGSDCRRSANDAPYATTGTYCIRLRDDDPLSSFMTTDNLDLSSYDELTVDFAYYVRSFENTEDFWLQISQDGGSTFTLVEDWVRTIDFNNDEFKTASVVIAGPFSATTKLRFRCDASGNGDWVYIDDVVINGCSGSGPPPTYTLTTNVSGQGSVSLNPAGGSYSAGTQVTMTANPASGWQFDNWSGDVTGSTNPETITINSNMTVTANFSQIPPTQYTLTTSVSGNGNVTLSPPGGVYNAGTQVTMTANPDTGNQFDNWSGDVTGSNNPETVTMNSNMSVTANFSVIGGGCTYVTIDDEGFESGWGIWNDGGSDCRRSANDAPYATTGTYCIRLRDNDPNSSYMTTDNMDLSSYDELTVDFAYYVRSFENVEDFWLQISQDGGATFTLVEDWVRTVDFNNNEFKTASVVIAGPFSATTQLRFRCDASGNSDWVYIDDVVVSGCTIAPTGGNSEIIVDENPKEDPAGEEIVDSFTEMLVFPNPVSDELTIAYKVASLEEVQLVVTDFAGRIVSSKKVPGGVHEAHVDVSQMTAGYYLVHLVAGKERTSKKFVVVK